MTDKKGSWPNTILAGLANYIDVGSIASGSAALALWATAYNLSPAFIGVLGVLSANAISAGVGALIGGRLCDLFGRKKIYQYDMLFYAFGMLWLVFSAQPWMIVVGFILVVLALFLVLAPFGGFGARIVFAHLAVVALVLTVLRSRMNETALWADARVKRNIGPNAQHASLRVLFTPRYLKSMLFSHWTVWDLEPVGRY